MSAAGAEYRLTFQAAVERAAAHGGLASFARAVEGQLLGMATADLNRQMAERLAVMRQAVAQGCAAPIRSRSGITGGDAHRLWRHLEAGRGLGGIASVAVARALAVAEVNAAMGRIVAAPTAGSCGIVPGVLLTIAENLSLDDSDLVDGLWVAGLVGQVIQNRIALSGAQGGCQAEWGGGRDGCGGGVPHGRGDAEAVVHAAAIALKNLLGLVCDPVAGLVEVPCIKRNAGGAAIAMVAADMALAGIRSVIPPDEVVLAMAAIGQGLPATLRETGEGGLAATASGRAIAASLAAAGGLEGIDEAPRPSAVGRQPAGGGRQ